MPIQFYDNLSVDNIFQTIHKDLMMSTGSIREEKKEIIEPRNINNIQHYGMPSSRGSLGCSHVCLTSCPRSSTNVSTYNMGCLSYMVGSSWYYQNTSTDEGLNNQARVNHCIVEVNHLTLPNLWLISSRSLNIQTYTFHRWLLLPTQSVGLTLLVQGLRPTHIIQRCPVVVLITSNHNHQ